MLKDLKICGLKQQILRADAVVVGAGIAGLILATRLVKKGVRTIVIESGEEARGMDPDPRNDVVQAGQTYRGAEAGRCRALGGTSRLWGGAMLPFLPCDMESHTAGWSVDWPVSLESLEKWFVEIERMFRLPSGSFDVAGGAAPANADRQFLLRSAKWPIFRLRNVAQTLRREIHAERLEVWLNATVTQFRLADSGRVTSVQAVASSGNELTVEARMVVVAAGAIESTRLMLLLDAENDNRIFKPKDLLGRYFFDHLSAPAAIVDPIDRVELNKTFGMRFERSGMRDLRIEPSPALRRAARLPGAFAHLAAQPQEGSAFTALRAIYRDFQSRSPLDWGNVVTLGLDVGWLAEAAWWRFAKRRVLAPRNATFELVAVIEQMPHEANTISLARDRRDRHGAPLARIDWRTHVQDLETFRALQTALTTWWAGSFYAGLAEVRPMPESAWSSRLLAGCDIFHPGGTTRMGRTAESGVVDANLRSFQIDNLFVVSTSSFPSGGGANPTFMLMAFALRAAERIACDLSSCGPFSALDFGQAAHKTKQIASEPLSAIGQKAQALVQR